MKALVLAAGFGTRLGSITKTTPKCLVELAPGFPILEHVLRRIEGVGIDEIVINTHYLAENVRSYVMQRKGRAHIVLSHEDEIRETGGAIKNARQHLEGDDFLVHNGDVYSTADLSAFIRAHRQSNAYITLGTKNLSSDRPIIANEQGVVCGWRNKKTGESIEVYKGALEQNSKECLYGCVSVYDQSYLTFLEPYPSIFSVVPTWFDAAREGKVVMTSTITGDWIDVGTVDQLEEARRLYASRRSKEDSATHEH